MPELVQGRRLVSLNWQLLRWLGDGYDNTAPHTLMNDNVHCFGGLHRHLTGRTRFCWLGVGGRSHNRQHLLDQ